jgi:hypothetical protein
LALRLYSGGQGGGREGSPGRDDRARVRLEPPPFSRPPSLRLPNPDLVKLFRVHRSLSLPVGISERGVGGRGGPRAMGTARGGPGKAGGGETTAGAASFPGVGSK